MNTNASLDARYREACRVYSDLAQRHRDAKDQYDAALRSLTNAYEREIECLENELEDALTRLDVLKREAGGIDGGGVAA